MNVITPGNSRPLRRKDRTGMEIVAAMTAGVMTFIQTTVAAEADTTTETAVRGGDGSEEATTDLVTIADTTTAGAKTTATRSDGLSVGAAAAALPAVATTGQPVRSLQSNPRRWRKQKHRTLLGPTSLHSCKMTTTLAAVKKIQTEQRHHHTRATSGTISSSTQQEGPIYILLHIFHFNTLFFFMKSRSHLKSDCTLMSQIMAPLQSSILIFGGQ